MNMSVQIAGRPTTPHEMDLMTPRQAKQLLASYLTENGLTFSKLTARTISFMDLARDGCVFVKLHGFNQWNQWDNIRGFAIKNGFRVEEE